MLESPLPEWMWWVFGFVFGPVPIVGLTILGFYLYYRNSYVDRIARMFVEKPLFIIPRGNPIDGAEEVTIRSAEGRILRACYIKTTASERKGVILFGLEFGSSRWSCTQYCLALIESGYDVFACELRNQGQSDQDPTYEPLQWATDRDLADMRAAVKYLHYRPDADPRGVGIFGISKGAGLGLLIAAEDRLVRCICTDGAFGTYTTLVPYMRKWAGSVIKSRTGDRQWVPDWFYGLIGLAAVGKVEQRRQVTFVSIERAIRRLRQPLLMIHGGGDNYIKPEMAESLYHQARRTTCKELWIVPGAKHNQALLTAREEYSARVTAFFDTHLASLSQLAAPLDSMTDTQTDSAIQEAIGVPSAVAAVK